MPLLLSPLLVAAATALPGTCAWDDPGRDPFLGDVPAAVDHYRDIPRPVRQRLKARMAEHRYDDFVEITRDDIQGSAAYEPEIRQMHFGAKGRRCAAVTRTAWRDTHREHGLVYCEEGHCILVPTVCRNVSRIVRRPDAPTVAALPPPLPAALPAAPPLGELLFAPPGAGPLDSSTASPGTADRDVFGIVSPLPATAPAGGEPIVGRPVPLPPPLPAPPIASPVPEPATWASMGLGLLVMAGVVRRRRRAPGFGADDAAR